MARRTLELAVVTEPTADGGCPEGYTALADGKCVRLTGDEAYATGAPSKISYETPSAREDDCPEGYHKMPDGSCMSNADMAPDTADLYSAEGDTSEYQVTPTWEGVLTVEGVESGDGRMFMPNSLTWGEPPLPLMWQKETAHGQGTNTSVRVGSITKIWREDDPTGRDSVKIIKGRGVIDIGSVDGAEVYRRMAADPPFLNTNSVDVDSVKDADVELKYAESGDGSDSGVRTLFAPPELTAFKKGRIRASTLVEIPAFVEAKLSLVDTPEMEESSEALTAGGTPHHRTATTSAPWDPAENERRLPATLTPELAGQMYAYLTYDMTDENGNYPKDAGVLPHHMVSADGVPGAANIDALTSAITALNEGRAGTARMTPEERADVWEHLAIHLRDAGREPTPLQMPENDQDAMVAATHVMKISDVPPREWFDEPTDVVPRGALTVTDEGRVYGYLAPAGVRHRSFPGQNRFVPLGKVDYSRFHGRETIVADGGRVTTGVITMNCGHATTEYQLTAAEASDHYDNSCSLVASVRVGENKNGVWVAGALLPDVEPKQIQRIMGCQLSGDWRPHLDRAGWRELAGALLVPVPGFPMARSAPSVEVSNGQLVASSVPVIFAQDKGNIDVPDAAKLNTAARRYAASRGWAMPDGAYPIRPANMHGETDLGKAIRAVGRGGAPHDQIRRHIMKRARALGASSQIPDNWKESGKLAAKSGIAALQAEITRARVAELRGRVAMHGTHNQKSHGSWTKSIIKGIKKVGKKSDGELSPELSEKIDRVDRLIDERERKLKRELGDKYR